VGYGAGQISRCSCEHQNAVIVAIAFGLVGCASQPASGFADLALRCERARGL
jgi:hypothetical protein